MVQLTMNLTGVVPPDQPGGQPPASPKFQNSALIGWVERLLVLVFVFNMAFPAVAFILTAKTVVRFHDTVDTKSAEYVLIGTLVSTLIAIGIGLIIPQLA